MSSKIYLKTISLQFRKHDARLSRDALLHFAGVFCVTRVTQSDSIKDLFSRIRRLGRRRYALRLGVGSSLCRMSQNKHIRVCTLTTDVRARPKSFIVRLPIYSPTKIVLIRACALFTASFTLF